MPLLPPAHSDRDGDDVGGGHDNGNAYHTPLNAATAAHQTPENAGGAAHQAPELPDWRRVNIRNTDDYASALGDLREDRFRRDAVSRRVEDIVAELDDSDSDPEMSVLAAARYATGHSEIDIILPEQVDAEDTSVEDDMEVDEDAEDVEDAEEHTSPIPLAHGLKEISNLGKFTVSSHKQGNGVQELRSDDLNLYWQSDGPQPHRLTVYFVKRVEIRDLRFYVHYAKDESYTPTKIVFKSGTSENNLIEFAQMTLDSPIGWQQVSTNGAGGGPDGNTLVSHVLQMQILENHQNGKDTHLRGIKIYAFDAESGHGPGRENNPVDDMAQLISTLGPISSPRDDLQSRVPVGEAGFSIPDFMREPEIR